MGRGILAASHGIQQAISTPAPPKTMADLPPVFHKIDWNTHQAIMHEMGQDGSEGQGYVNTSQSWSVNAYLRSNGDMNAANKASGWNLSEGQIRQIIQRMDGQMKPLSRSIQAVRFVGADMLKDLGLPAKATPSIAAKLQQMIQNGKLTEYTPKAYTSFSTDAKKNVFTSKPIKINYQISKGTPCIMTANASESEGVLARKVKHKITGARWSKGEFGGRLEIDITV